MGGGFRDSRREQNFKVGGGGLSRKAVDQTDTLLILAGFKTWVIVRHVLHERPPFSGRTGKDHTGNM
jgi:hypothetical protein